MSREMRRLLEMLGGEDPLALDDDSADRLLDGRLDPADAPPGYVEVAAVMAAVTAPGRPNELAGASSALQAFRAAGDRRPAPPRRARMLVKLLTVKAVAAAFTGALAVGGMAAAATGSLPEPAQRMAHRMVGAVPPAASQDRQAHENGSAADAKGPDVTGPAKAGLCTAYLAGKGGDHGRRNDSVAFKALEAAAGGADKVADFCKDVVHSPGGQGNGQGQERSGAAGDNGQSGEEHGQAGDDHGQGQGGPPEDPSGTAKDNPGQGDDHSQGQPGAGGSGQGGGDKPER
jgi:hypothetical protein